MARWKRWAKWIGRRPKRNGTALLLMLIPQRAVIMIETKSRALTVTTMMRQAPYLPLNRAHTTGG